MTESAGRPSSGTADRRRTWSSDAGSFAWIGDVETPGRIAYRARLALAERLCREIDRINPT
jgi:hypothetical protein